MIYSGRIVGTKDDPGGTYLKIFIPDEHVQASMTKYKTGNVINCEVRVDDTRRITADQRKRIYATLRDIANYLGDFPEYYKEFLKFGYCSESGQEYFSLSDCSIETARGFINYIIDFILMHNIPLTDIALNRTDDIDHYLYSCLKFRRCCRCGKPADLHHFDALGAGRDRRHYDDKDHRKMALCRTCHVEIETIGRDTFCSKYHVYGIIYKEE